MTFAEYTLGTNSDIKIHIYPEKIDVRYSDKTFTFSTLKKATYGIDNDCSSFIIKSDLVIVCRYVFLVCSLVNESCYVSTVYSFETPRLPVSLYIDSTGCHLDPNIEFFPNCLYLSKHNVITPITLINANSSKITFNSGSRSLFYFIEHDRWIYDEPNDNLNIPLEMWPRLSLKELKIVDTLRDKSAVLKMSHADFLKYLYSDAHDTKNAAFCGVLLACLKQRNFSKKIKCKKLPKIAQDYYLVASLILGRQSKHFATSNFTDVLMKTDIFSTISDIDQIASTIVNNKMNI